LSIEDKGQILRRLNTNPYVYLFHLVDMDERYASNARWFFHKRGPDISALALLYLKAETPIFLLLEPDNLDALPLINEVLPQLPDKLYCFLSDGILEAMEKTYKVESKNRLLRMKWTRNEIDRFPVANGPEPIRLNEGHERIIREFVPAVWLDSAMLKCGYYYGYFEDGDLVSLGGTSLFSKTYGAAVIGSVGTREDHRRRGLAERIIMKLMRDLKGQVPYIGLNVLADNEPAIQCYLKCGFEVCTELWECVLSK